MLNKKQTSKNIITVKINNEDLMQILIINPLFKNDILKTRSYGYPYNGGI